jgi:hypothetical protein
MRSQGLIDLSTVSNGSTPKNTEAEYIPDILHVLSSGLLLIHRPRT